MPQSSFQNSILSRMPRADFARLRPKLSLVRLPRRERLELSNRLFKFVIFPEDGIISVVTHAAGDHIIEVGLIGREGMTGMPLVMGADRSPNDTSVQVAAHGWSIGVDDFRHQLQVNPSMAAMCHLFTQVFFVQVASTALANGRATIGQRLARSLLMSLDRLDDAKVPLTHEFLSVVLGVRRSGVTTALGLLEARDVVSLSRGKIVVLNRAALVRQSGSFYGSPELEYRRLFGVPTKPFAMAEAL
jgi:CRP-like cAMP-binding protein